MAAKKVLISGKIAWAFPEIEQMRKDGYEMLELESATREEFYKDCAPGGKYDGVLAIYRHNNSASAIGIYDADLIKHLPESVRYLCHNGAGYDQIDVQACTERRIWVSNTPEAVNDATATTGIYLLIAALRKFQVAEANARKGKFKEDLTPGNDPEGKVLGIVGMGGIGRAIAVRAMGFSMSIQYHNRSPVSPEVLKPPLSPETVAYKPTLEELLSTSDVVALSIPLNEHTKGFMGRKEFAMCKDGATLINTARGGVIDEEAMIEALESGKLKSVGLDVFPDEPNINLVLREHPRVALLPHMGTETRESQHKMEVRAFTNIIKALTEGKLMDPVLEQRNSRL